MTSLQAAAAALAVAAATSAAAIHAKTDGAAVTFNKDVAPILFAHCVSCHRPGEVAPMSLLTFGEVRPWARAVRQKVLAREMPPSYADPAIGTFRNTRRLTDEQIDVLARWSDAGAPEGDGRPPAAPVFVDGWNSAMSRPPDQVIDLPIQFELPAEGEIPTFTVWLKLPFRDDRFVEAMELRPSNRRAVHHSGISLADLPARTRLGRGSAWPGGPILDGVPVFGDGQPFRAASAEQFGDPLLFYVPGGGFLKLPQGVAKRLRAGSYLAWGQHYVTTGRPERITMHLGLWFSKGTVAHEAFSVTASRKIIVEGREYVVDALGRAPIPNIPAHAENWAITGLVTFPNAVTIYALWPHMHLRGKDMTFTLIYPNGREETLLSVPKYTLHWQATYELARPLSVPARSTIRAVAHYDNSSGNRLNPAPDQEVTWGPQSWNEMFLPFIELSVDKDDLRLGEMEPRSGPGFR
jgi:hypothetical protein